MSGGYREHRSVRVSIESTLEHLIPPILDPAIDDTRAEIANRTTSCPGGFESFLKVGLSLVLIGWVDNPRLKLAVELLEGGQLLERVQVPVIATLEGGERLAIIKQSLRTLSEASVHLCSKLFPMLIRTKKPDEKFGLFVIRPMFGTWVIDCASK